MNFRTAKKEDLPALLELYRDLNPDDPVLEVDAEVMKIWDRILNDERLHLFFAELDGAIVASSILDIVPNLTRGARPFGVLQNVVVKKDRQGKGLGSEFNRKVLNFAWEQNCYQVLVQTGRPETIPFYEGLGFKRDKVGLVAKP